VQFYHLYCDETYLHSEVAFAFGALVCTSRRAQILKDQLSAVRNRLNYFGELKWKKISIEKLPIYKKFVDVFLDDRYVTFSLMKVSKGQYWKEWASTEEERFFKSYYVFLMQNIGPHFRYNTYLDCKPLQKGYRWDRLHFLINRNRREEWGAIRNIKVLSPVDSKSEDLIQLADLLLGAFTSNSQAKAKISLQEYIRHNIARYEKPKIRMRDWTPRK
jgi:hypothetical protein